MVPEWVRRSRSWGLHASKVSRQGRGHHVPPDRSPSHSGYHCVLWLSRCTGKRSVCGSVCEGEEVGNFYLYSFGRRVGADTFGCLLDSDVSHPVSKLECHPDR